MGSISKTSGLLWLGHVSGAVALILLGPACNELLGTRDLYFEPSQDAANDDDKTSDDVRAKGDDDTRDAGGGDANVFEASCSADLSIDRLNCGACGHDCSNGTCEGGICTLVGDVAGLMSVAVRDATVYFGTAGYDAGVAKCPASGCGTNGPSRLAPKGTKMEPAQLVVDDTHVYVSDTANTTDPGGVHRVGIDGAGYARLGAPSIAPSWGVVVSALNVFWTTNVSAGYVQYCALPDCAGGPKIATIASSPTLLARAPNGTLVWAESSGRALKHCLSYTNCAPVAFPQLNAVVSALTVDANDVAFWGTTAGEISGCVVPGCIAASKMITDEQFITAIAVRGTGMYWATIAQGPDGNFVDSEGTIRGCTLSSCASTAHDVAKHQRAPRGIALDATSVYWVNGGSYSKNAGVGSVAKAPR